MSTWFDTSTNLKSQNTKRYQQMSRLSPSTNTSKSVCINYNCRYISEMSNAVNTDLQQVCMIHAPYRHCAFDLCVTWASFCVALFSFVIACGCCLNEAIFYCIFFSFIYFYYFFYIALLYLFNIMATTIRYSIQYFHKLLFIT